ncbi:MAG: adenosylcobinamide-GDP ribazoletransferase [Elusimicrobiota bacterium]
MIKIFLSAISFLTIIPVPKKFSLEFKHSVIFFPLVGLFIGGILILINYLSSFLFSKNVVDMVVIVSLIIITGGLHLDGFADTCDGFYAGKDKSDSLRIMDDAHIGTMGVAGLFCILGLKFFALQSIPQKIIYPALLFFPILSRWNLVFACTISKSAKNEGLGKTFIGTVSKNDLVIATIITFFVSLILFKTKGILILIATLLITVLFLKYVIKKIDGITGDILGALNEICEIFVLLILCINEK